MATAIGEVLHGVQSNSTGLICEGSFRVRDGVPASADAILRLQWPDTRGALVATFFEHDKIGRTYIRPPCPPQALRPVKCNDAGYLLRGLTVFTERAWAVYPQVYSAIADEAVARRRLMHDLDVAAARETRYQWQRQRSPRDIRPYLVTCWLSLLAERPERIWPERYR